jgi:hypothetical protein
VEWMMFMRKRGWREMVRREGEMEGDGEKRV